MSFAIGLDNPKTGQNIGTVLRSAFNFGASMVFVVGERYQKQRSDNIKAYRHIPLMNFKSWEDYFSSVICDWDHIGIEITKNSGSLFKFTHTRSAVYLFGPEDGSLSKEATARCRNIISIPSRRCLNLAVAASIVMYDRNQKRSGRTT